MEINNDDLQRMIKIRSELILAYSKCKDYKNNKNAIMREIDHVNVLVTAIKDLDTILGKFVKFS